MYLAVKAVGLFVVADWPPLWRLPTMVIVGVASYALLVAVLHKAAMRDLIDMLRSAKGAGAGIAPVKASHAIRGTWTPDEEPK